MKKHLAPAIVLALLVTGCSSQSNEVVTDIENAPKQSNSQSKEIPNSEDAPQKEDLVKETDNASDYDAFDESLLKDLESCVNDASDPENATMSAINCFAYYDEFIPDVYYARSAGEITLKVDGKISDLPLTVQILKDDLTLGSMKVYPFKNLRQFKIVDFKGNENLTNLGSLKVKQIAQSKFL